MQDVAGRGDGIGAVEERAVGQHRRGNESDGGGLVSGDLPVGARRQPRLGDPVMGVEDLGGLGVVVSGQQSRQIGPRHLLVVLELVLNPALGVIHRALVEPEHQPQSEEILAASRLPRAQGGFADGPQGQGGQGDLDETVPCQASVLQRIGLVAGFIEVLLGEGVGIHGEDAAVLQLT